MSNRRIVKLEMFFIVVLITELFLALVSQTISAQSFNVVKDNWANTGSVKAADMDLDGKVDLVYSEFIGTRAYIAYGEGGASFEAPEQIGNLGLSTVTLDYVDSDSLLDIVIAKYADGVYVLLNNGNRTFTTSSWSTEGENWPFVVTGYFNDDAELDIVVGPGNVYFGDGNGGFPTNSALPVDQVHSADVSDFNKDGYDDLVVTTQDTTGFLAQVLLNDGNGNFTSAGSFDPGALSISVSASNSLADFNNDGNPDFALISPKIGISCSSGGWVCNCIVALGDGSGGFSNVDSIEICGSSHNLITADIDRDNELDIVTVNPFDTTVVVFLGNGDGTFSMSAPIELETLDLILSLSTADLDIDGNPDLITGGGISHPDSIICLINNAPSPEILDDVMITVGYSTVNFDVTNPAGHLISRLKNSVGGARFDRLDKNSDGSLDVQTTDNNLQYGDYSIVLKKKPNITALATFDAHIRIGDSELLRIFKDYETPGSSKSSNPNDSIVFRYSVEEYPSVSPASGRTEFDNTPRFIWSGLWVNQSGLSYDFQLDSHIDFSSPMVVQTGLTNKFYNTAISLDRDKVYYWRVRSFDGSSYSEWSNAFAVYIGPFFCGDINNDGSNYDTIDLTYLVNYIFRNGPAAPIVEQADLNGDGSPANVIDLNVLVNYKCRLIGSQPQCGI